MSPTARTLKRLRRLGWTAAVVEKVIPHTFIKRDYLGCIDILGVRADTQGVLGVQATSANNISSRVKKAKERPELAVWLAAGNAWQCWGWVKRGSRWAVRIVELSGQDCEPVVVEKPARRLVSRHKQAELF